MKFSIVTPLLDGARFLKSAITSLQAQSHGDYEHLIIDAGSKDGSIEIVQAATARDPRIRLVEIAGCPLYRAIDAGFERSDGEMLAWLNSDDLYAPWALATVAKYARARKDCRWFAGLPGCWDEDGALRYVRPEGWRPRFLIRGGWFHKDLLGFLQQETMFFRRDLYFDLDEADRAAFGEARLAGDFILWKRLAKRASLSVIPSALGGFRRHGANKSTIFMSDYMAEVRKDGSVNVPWPFTGIVRRSYRLASAAYAEKLAGREDAAFY